MTDTIFISDVVVDLVPNAMAIFQHVVAYITSVLPCKEGNIMKLFLDDNS